MKNTTQEFRAYKAAADAVRRGDNSAEALALLASTEKAYRATIQVKPTRCENLWDLPVFKSCWRGDALAVRA